MSSKTDRSKIEALAEKYIKKEKYEEAIFEYQKLLSGDEQDIQVWNIIGDLYIKANQKDRAIGEFKKIASHFEEKGIYTKSIAIYKRITRLAPEDIQSLKKLADLYCERGFLSEARTEYQKLAHRLTKLNKSKEAIKTYQKLLKLDSNDIESRLNLADLFIKEGQLDQAVEELDEAAEFKMRQNAFQEAGKILEKARALKSDHSRTLENLIELFKSENKRKDALKLVNEILRKDKENLKALYLLANLCFEDKEFKKAEEIFTKIVASHPKEVEARVRLGRIHIQNSKYDKALEIYEPIVDILVKKQREDKAIGLLGLILTAKKGHIPTLEKLASIYREKGQKKNFEIVARKLSKEYTAQKMMKEARSLREEFADIFPEKADEMPEEKAAREEAEIPKDGLPSGEEKVSADEPEMKEQILEEERSMTEVLPPVEKEEKEEVQVPDEKREDIVGENIKKLDLYVEQGLIRDAKRMLEDLRMDFPDDERINEKIMELGAIASQVKEENIAGRVEKAAEREKELFSGNEKLTSAEIFADTDIIPLASQETAERKYYDLSHQIEDEIEAIKHLFYQQTRGDTTVVEKELSAIVNEFKIKVDKKIGKADLEARYNLGIAYLEQGLIDEAIKEFMMASNDRKWEMECFTNLGECHKRKKDFMEAIKWYEKAAGLVDKNSIQAFALKYEIASLYEAQNDSDRALRLFGEVKDWNPDYGEVTSRIKNIEEQAAK
jgi:tetratricopeptide (TPR) repeat protein